MSKPHIAEISYEAFCQYMDTAQPPWGTLPLTIRLAWGMAAQAAVHEVHRLPCLLAVKEEPTVRFHRPHLGPAAAATGKSSREEKT